MTADQGSAGQDIADLVRSLRDAGFKVGTSEAIDATALLMALVDRGAPPDNAALVRSRLRPIFCKSAEQQHGFAAIFDGWWARRAVAVDPTEIETGTPGGEKKVPEPAGTVTRPSKLPSRRSTARGWIALALVLAVSAGTVYLVWFRPIPSAPAPGPAPSPPGQQPATPQPDPRPARPAIDGIVPATRGNVEIRPWWVWVLAAAPLAALIAIGVPALVLSRTRPRRRSEPMFLNTNELEREASRIVPEMRPEIGDRLARHIRSHGIDIERQARRPSLDVRRTLEATIRNQGVPTLRFSVVRAYPSYLVLVDVTSDTDPRGRLFYQWAERLQREGLDVEIMLLRRTGDREDAVRVCDVDDVRRGGEKWIPIRRLRQPPFGERLVVVSDGDPFVDTEGQWRADAERARFHRWHDRALFTPVEPRDWADREENLERVERPNDPGFVVLPLDESALASWTDFVLTGQLTSIALTDPQRFPALLRRGRADRFEADEPPDAETVDRLIAQLDLYLGDRGFYWLAAIATLPMIRWELVLLLGKAALGRLPRLADESSLNASIALNYRRLVRLPWLRSQAMPDWLRLRLLLELSEARQAELREVVRSLLGKLSPDEFERGIRLGFERPPHEAGQWKGEGPKKFGDPIYLGYMSGVTPDQLAIRAPQEWQSWIDRIQRPEARRQRRFANLQARGRAAWARLVWRNGAPYAGINRRRLAWLGVLLLPLAAALGAAHRFAPESEVEGTLSRAFFTGLVHDRAIVPPSVPTAVTFSSDGAQIASGHLDGSIRIWDARSLKQLGATLRSGGPVHSIAFSPDGSRVGAESDVRVVLANLRNGLTIFYPGATDVYRTQVTFTSAGRLFAGGSTYDGDVASSRGFPLLADPNASGPVMSLSGSRLVVGSASGEIQLWDTVQGDRIGSIPGSGAAPRAITISPDGSRTAYVLDTYAELLTSGFGLSRLARLADAPPRRVSAIAFTPDSARLVTAAEDGTLRLWDAATGAAVGSTFFAHEGPITGISVTADNRRMVTSSRDGTIRFWDAATERLPVSGGRSGSASSWTRDERLKLPRVEQRAIGWVSGLSAFTLLLILGGAIVVGWSVQGVWQESRVTRLARHRDLEA